MRRTIFSMIAEARERYGSSPFAFRKTDAGWESRTFGQVFDDARAFASFARDRGYAAEDRIAVYAEGSPSWIVAEYGAVVAGCIAVPLSFKLLPEEIAYRLEHSGARAVCANANHIAKIAQVARDVAARTGQPIDLVCLDDDYDAAALDYPREKTFLMADAIRAGTAAFPRTAAVLDKVEAECPEDAVVTISYTSGTTGNPKGIMLTHANYWINSLDSVDMFEIPHGGYRDFVVLPVDHSFAQTVGIHAAVRRGIQLWFVDSRGGGVAILRNIPDNMRQAEPDFMMTVPALSSNFMKKIRAEMDKRGGLAKKLFDLGIESGIKHLGDGTRPPRTAEAFFAGLVYRPLKALVLDKVRTTVFGPRMKFFTGGGASFDIGQQRFYRALGLPLYQGYGMTEASPVISTNIGSRVKLGTAGVPLPNVEIRVVKDDGSAAAPGEKGEIRVRGPNVMKGYFRNPEATAEALVDGWLRTGDLGWIDEDGYLTVAGRAKALLISADGEKYSPEGIEDAILNSATLVNQVFVWNDHKKFTCALITLEESLVKKAIKEHMLNTPETLLEAVKKSFYSFKADPSYGKLVPSAWTPATFQIVDEPFSEKNGLVNSTMKLVRYKVAEAHADLLDYVYGKDGSSYRNGRNLESLKKFFA